MNFLEIPAGGMRLFGDDINYLQIGATQAISATLRNVANYNNGWVVLTGFETAQLSGNTWSISGGWAFIDNEICYFRGDNFVFTTGVVDWALVHFESFFEDFPVGSRLLSNGTTYNPQKRREIRLSASATGKTLAMTNRYEYVLKLLLDTVSSSQSNTVMLENGVTIQPQLPVNLYKRDNRVYLTVNVETDPAKNYTGNGDLLFTLPSGFRPINRIIRFPVANGSETISFISIDENGTVGFLNKDAANWTAGSPVYIHNVSFDAF